MTDLLRNTTLDDAYFFLNQAKGLPEIKSSEALRQRYIRACILFSWIALEERLENYLTENKLAAPSGLKDRLATALKHAASGLGIGEFQQARKVRNMLTHAVGSGAGGVTLLTIANARQVFNYCGGMIAQLARHRKLCLSLDDGTWRLWTEKRGPRLP